MKVIWHAGVDSRMIALKQAVILGVFDHLQQSLYVYVSIMGFVGHSKLFCIVCLTKPVMGKTLHCNVKVFTVRSIVQRRMRVEATTKALFCLQGFFISATYYTVV